VIEAEEVGSDLSIVVLRLAAVDEAALLELLKAVPLEAHAYKAFIGGEGPLS